MAVKIAFGIQKGGQGKTLSAVVIAELLALSGYKVLVIDLDSQGNATQMLTLEDVYKYSGETIFEAMKEGDIKPYIKQVKENLHFVPAEDMLAGFPRYIYTNNISFPMRVLMQTVSPIDIEYDFILLDCPPNMGDIVLNAVICADYLIIPFELGGFSLDALSRYMSFVDGVRIRNEQAAEVLGILFTLKDNRSKVEKKIAISAREKYGDLVFNAEIRKLARLKEYSLIGVNMGTKADTEALDNYILAVEEMIERIKNRRINNE